MTGLHGTRLLKTLRVTKLFVTRLLMTLLVTKLFMTLLVTRLLMTLVVVRLPLYMMTSLSRPLHVARLPVTQLSMAVVLFPRALRVTRLLLVRDLYRRRRLIDETRAPRRKLRSSS